MCNANTGFTILRSLKAMLFLVVLPLLLGWKQVVITPTDKCITYMGRVQVDSSASLIYWSGSSVKIRFTGNGISALLKDEKGQNYFYVIVDGKITGKVKPDTIQKLLPLAQNLRQGIHEVALVKLTEEAMGKTWLYNFTLNINSRALPPTPLSSRKIEFYGNSITSGYSLEDTAGDSRDPVYFNNYLTYASLTARHYKAQYHCISKSGIGLMLSWFPVIMPELYDRLDPADAASKWDFNSYQPVIVVVDLLQNDSWLVKKTTHPQYIARFGTTPPSDSFIIDSYKRFIRQLIALRPNATIICTLGSMDATKEGSPWMGYVSKAVSELADPKVLVHFFPYNNTGKHPKKADHAAMAKSLISFIDKKIKW